MNAGSSARSDVSAVVDQDQGASPAKSLGDGFGQPIEVACREVTFTNLHHINPGAYGLFDEIN
jgi:hypothetical protein